jgi:hypothetical protein
MTRKGGKARKGAAWTAVSFYEKGGVEHGGTGTRGHGGLPGPLPCLGVQVWLPPRLSPRPLRLRVSVLERASCGGAESAEGGRGLCWPISTRVGLLCFYDRMILCFYDFAFSHPPPSVPLCPRATVFLSLFPSALFAASRAPSAFLPLCAFAPLRLCVEMSSSLLRLCVEMSSSLLRLGVETSLLRRAVL